jgi:outer membrane protein assembly factor BamD (BamD/ComL family)
MRRYPRSCGSSGSPFSAARNARPASLAILLLLVCCGGCQSIVNPISQWRAAYDGNLVKGPTKEEMADASSPSDSQNLFERWITPRMSPASNSNAKSSSTLILGSDGWRPIAKPAPNPKADAEYQSALKLFQQGNLAEAENQFAKIAKSRKGTPWGENAQYYLAETQYQRKKYFYAHDNFELLHKDYPATEYLDKLVSREFAIAHLWMAQDDPKTPKPEQIPWTGRFDGSRPLLDTQGYALKALEHVRHNDPSGPLADDAALEIAEFYMKRADYESAALYYDQLIADFPKSPFLQKAQHAAIDARMKAYLGPDYDTSGLEKARVLVRKTMDAFPERQASFEGLYHTLDVINDAEAEKTFRIGTHYKKIGKVASAEFYYGKIPQRWPSSPWAVKAKGELAQLAKMPRKPSKPSKIIMQPGASDPYYSAGPMGAMGGMGGMGMPGMGMGGMGGMGGMM